MLANTTLSARTIKRLLNLWPPLLFSGIQITELSDDFTYCKARLRDWKRNRNSHGTQFGGSLFAMTDPIYAMMLNAIFGKRCYVWDKYAEIDFIQPGRGEVYLDCYISTTQLNDIKNAISHGEKYLPEFQIRLFDSHNNTIATVKRIVYIRLKKEFRP